MSVRSTLDRLAERASKLPHDYRPSILQFDDLNLDKLKKSFRLSERGSERGAKDEPPATSQVPDDIENEIISYIESEAKRTQEKTLRELDTYEQRLLSLDLLGRFEVVRHEASNGVANFRAEAERGIDRLFSPGRLVQDLEKEHQALQKSANINRTADYPATPRKILQWGIISILLLFEIIGNSYFLSKGSAYGLIGGFAEAVLIAFLNIGTSMVVAHFGLRQMWHHRSWRRILGFICLLLWILFAITFNLLVAHYRDVAGAFLEGGGKLAISALVDRPFGLLEFHSWVLFGIGVLFAFIAMVDALYLDDFYPGYGHLERRRAAARNEYADLREASISELDDIKEETLEAMRLANEDLSKRQAEHNSIVESWQRTTRLYDQHLDHLERAGNVLLSTYQSANRQARKSAPPPRFDSTWDLTNPPLRSDQPPSALPREKLEADLSKAQHSLSIAIESVHREFEQAYKRYKPLAEVIEGPGEEI